MSIHNIRFLHRLVAEIKRAIREDRLGDFRDEIMPRLTGEARSAKKLT